MFTCCGFSVIAAESNGNTQTVQLEKYTNAEKGYSIEYPSDWKKNDVPQLDLVLFAPTKEAGEMPHASVNIVSEKVGKGIHLEQFYSESVSNLSTALKEVQVEKSGTAELNGITGKWIQYTHVMQGVKFKVLQYFVVADETIFLITFSSSADDFEQYRPDFEKIANSFKVANTTAPAQPAKKAA
jgi:hypothetical protein